MGEENKQLAQVIEVKRSVSVGARTFYLVAFNFSLENKVFKEMVAKIREEVGDERKFFWDGELKVWLVEQEVFESVKEVALRYYRRSTDLEVEELRRQIRDAVGGV